MPMTFDLNDIYASQRCATYWARYRCRSTCGRGALVHRGERRVKQDHERTMMLSVTWPLNISPGQRCIYAGRGDVVGHCLTKPYSATFDNVAKHTYKINYRALVCPTMSSRLR